MGNLVSQIGMKEEKPGSRSPIVLPHGMIKFINNVEIML